MRLDGNWSFNAKTVHKWGERNSGYVPIKSVRIFPSQNLPVGLPSMKSFPYGGKLHFDTVSRLLLLPVSRIESPNAISAGNVPFLDASVGKIDRTITKTGNKAL